MTEYVQPCVDRLPSSLAVKKIENSSILESLTRSRARLLEIYSEYAVEVESKDHGDSASSVIRNSRNWARDTLSHNVGDSSVSSEKRACATAVLSFLGREEFFTSAGRERQGMVNDATAWSSASSPDDSLHGVKPLERAWYAAYLALGGSVFNPTDFGFNSAFGLARAFDAYAAAYLRGEIWREAAKSWWSVGRGRVAHNLVWQSIHGYVTYSQLSAPEIESKQMALFPDCDLGEELSGRVRESSICTYQDSSQMMLTLLCYGEFLGLSGIPEIADWRSALREEGEILTNTAERFGGEDYSLFTEMAKDQAPYGMLSQRRRFPISIHQGPHEPNVIPAIQGDRLKFFLVPGRSDSNNLERYFASATPLLEYEPSDLPAVLRATMKLFSRDRYKLHILMKIREAKE